MSTEWLEEYYKSNERNKRKEMLEQSLATNQETSEDLYRKELWELRYGQRGKASSEIDYFIRAYLNLMVLAKTKRSILNSRTFDKMIGEIEADLYLAKEKNEMEEQILFEEYCNLFRFYIHLCLTDRNYTTTLFGLMHISGEDAAAKVKAELSHVLETVPAMINKQDEFALLKKAAEKCMAEL